VAQVHDKMKAAGIHGNVITYNALISAAARQGQVERAFALWDEMGAAGLAPNVVTYSALIAACQHGCGKRAPCSRQKSPENAKRALKTPKEPCEREKSAANTKRTLQKVAMHATRGPC